MLTVTDARKPYPLSWEEQRTLFQALPEHLARMCLYKVNTGCREQEVCQLRWDWEVMLHAGLRYADSWSFGLQPISQSGNSPEAEVDVFIPQLPLWVVKGLLRRAINLHRFNAVRISRILVQKFSWQFPLLALVGSLSHLRIAF